MTFQEGSTSLPGLTPEQLAWHEQTESKEYYAILSMFIEMWWVWWKANPENAKHLRPEQWQTTEKAGKYYPLFFLNIMLEAKLHASVLQFNEFIQAIIDPQNLSNQTTFSNEFVVFLTKAHSRLLQYASSSRSHAIKTSKKPLESVLLSGIATALVTMNKATGAADPHFFAPLLKMLSGVDVSSFRKMFHELEQKSNFLFPPLEPKYVIDLDTLRSWGLGASLPCPAGSPATPNFSEYLVEWRNFLKVPTDLKLFPLRELVQWYVDHIIKDVVPWYKKLNAWHRLMVDQAQRNQIENWIDLDKRGASARSRRGNFHALS